MQNKIDWYQEVVDLEPSSKLFFPLAKMVAESDVPRAVTTLQSGLERHPEFIEARLFYVELLHKNKEQEDYAARLETQLAVLSPLMMRYAGFWQAWGNILSEKDKSSDTGLAVSFMGALFENGALSMADIFSAGLQAVVARGGTGLAETAQAVSIPSASAVASPAVSAPASEAPVTPASTVASVPASESAPTAVLTPDPISPSESVAPELTPEPTPTPEVTPAPEAMSVTAAQAVKSVTKKPKISLKVTQLSVPKVAPDTASAMVKDGKTALGVEHEESDEPFSLRTRSMAEVLAEQGDYAAAQEIYTELLHAAESAEEKDELQSKIAQLQSITESGNETKNAPAPKVADTKDAKATPPGNERMISALESLAERLENRAHS